MRVIVTACLFVGLVNSDPVLRCHQQSGEQAGVWQSFRRVLGLSIAGAEECVAPRQLAPVGMWERVGHAVAFHRKPVAVQKTLTKGSRSQNMDGFLMGRTRSTRGTFAGRGDTSYPLNEITNPAFEMAEVSEYSAVAKVVRYVGRVFDLPHFWNFVAFFDTNFHTSYLLRTIMENWATDMTVCGRLFVVFAVVIVLVCGNDLSRVTNLYAATKFYIFPTELQAAARKRGLSVESFRLLLEATGVQEETDIADLAENMIDAASRHVPPLHVESLKRWQRELAEEDANKTVFRVVVAGQTSDGKSSLINNLVGRKPLWDDYAEAKGTVRGTTKKVKAYEVKARWVPSNMRLVLYDIPGYGDSDCSPVMVLQQLKAVQDSFKPSRPFDALLLCAKASDASLQIGPKLVGDTVRLAFDGRSKWDCIAWVGTHGDLCPKAKPGEESRWEQFVGEKRELINTEIGGCMREDYSCVVDCQPINDNTKSSNLDPLRDIIKKMMDKKVKQELNGEGLAVSTECHADPLEERRTKAKFAMDRYLGDLKTDDATQMVILSTSAERLGASVETLTQTWKDKADKERAVADKFQQEVQQMKDEEKRKDRERYERDQKARQQEEAAKAKLEEERKAFEKEHEARIASMELKRQREEEQREKEYDAKKRKLDKDHEAFRKRCEEQAVAEQEQLENQHRVVEEERRQLQLKEDEARQKMEDMQALQDKILQENLAKRQKFEKAADDAPLATDRDVLALPAPVWYAGPWRTPAPYCAGTITGHQKVRHGYHYTVRFDCDTDQQFTEKNFYKREELLLFEDLTAEEMTVWCNPKGKKGYTQHVPPNVVYAWPDQSTLDVRTDITWFHVRVCPSEQEIAVKRRDCKSWRKPFQIKVFSVPEAADTR